MHGKSLILAPVLLALAIPGTAQASSVPIQGQRTATVRVHDTTMRTQMTALKSHATVTTIAFYVDGKLAPASGVGSSNCRLDYLTNRGVTIRVDACGQGKAPIGIAVANVGRHPHRVTVRLRFVV